MNDKGHWFYSWMEFFSDLTDPFFWFRDLIYDYIEKKEAELEDG